MRALALNAAVRRQKKIKMALSEELPIYRDTLKLLHETVQKLQDFPKFYRYTIGERMLNANLDMMELIYEINSSRNKLPYLQKFLARYQIIVILYRLCVEKKIMTPAQYAHIALIIAKIGKQATGWKNSLDKTERR